MDPRERPGGGMHRRTFLAAALSGVTSVVLASCTGTPEPSPSPTTATPMPSLPPSPTPTPGPDGLPPLTALRRSRWGADPYARGAFSYDDVGSTARLREALAQPVRERVWFAGEACSATSPGTLRGAIESGRAAAESVADVAGEGERIAVIGAGLAGLTAANLLVERGFEVVVIEARDRAGGRVQSVDDDAFGGPIQLGAFLADLDPALQALLGEADVQTDPLTRPDTALAPDGTWVPVDPVGAASIAVAHDWATAQPNDVSLATALVRSGAVDLGTAPDEHGVRQVDWLTHAIASGVEPAYGASTISISALSAEPSRFDASLRVIRGRFADVIDRLAEAVDIAGLSTVTRVVYDDDRVSLRLDTGESLRADRVIVTAPLGVLQTDTIRFRPTLPYTHQRAISLLGMGLVDTAWLRFEEPFWRRAADEDTGAAASPDVLTVVGSTQSVAAWVDVGRTTGEPVLVAVIAATQARRLEALDDSAFQEELLAELLPFATASG